MVSTAAFHARVRDSVPGLGGLKETKNVPSPSTCESQYCGEAPWPRGSVLGLRPPGLEFRILCLEDSAISIISPSSGGSPAQFSLYVHKGGLKPDSFHLICICPRQCCSCKCYVRWRFAIVIILWNTMTSQEIVLTGYSVKVMLCKSPSPILYCVRLSCQNIACQGYWVSQNRCMNSRLSVLTIPFIWSFISIRILLHLRQKKKKM